MKYRQIISTFFIVVGLSLGIRQFLFEFYIVSTREMQPTLYENDYVLIEKYTRYFRKPHRGDVILFKKPSDSQFYLRRVIGLPQDRLYYSNNKLVINDKIYPTSVSDRFEKTSKKGDITRFTEELPRISYDVLLREDEFLSFGPYKIPDGHYFVMGDHRSVARDSRNWARHLKSASSQVRLYRIQSKQNKILIPKNMRFFYEKDRFFPIALETTKDIFLENSFVDVPVQTLKGGLGSPIPANQILQVEGALKHQVKAISQAVFKGGRDDSLVFIKHIKGRAHLVLWACHKSLYLLKFLCPIGGFKQDRWFQKVHL